MPVCAACDADLKAKGLLGDAAPSHGAAQALVDSRFRPLSSLPAEKRFPQRGGILPLAPPPLPLPDGAPLTPQPRPTSGVVLRGSPVEPAPRPEPSLMGQVGQQPRELPGMPAVKLQKISVPDANRKVGFNCPACLAILVIKQPDNYDWTAAPCPNCQTVILPPRIVPPSPFRFAASPLEMTPEPPPLLKSSATGSKLPRTGAVIGVRVARRDSSQPLPLPDARLPQEQPVAENRRFPLLPSEIARSAVNPF
jgi:hypothetical protein